MPIGFAVAKALGKGNRGGKLMQTIDQVLSARNLTEACKDVIKNKGSWGIDKMSIKELKPYLDKNREELSETIRLGEYIPQPIRGKEILKRNRKMRLLGIPTVIDRMLQQAVTRVIMPQFEYMFYSQSKLFSKVFMSSQPKAARFKLQFWLSTKTQYIASSFQIVGLYQFRLP